MSEPTTSGAAAGGAMREKIQLVVEAPEPKLSGLNATIALLKQLEDQLGRTQVKMLGLSDVTAGGGIKAIEQRIRDLQKKSGAIKPVELGKLFDLGDEGFVTRAIGNFKAKLASQKVKLSDFFTSSGDEFVNPARAAKFVDDVVQQRRRAASSIINMINGPAQVPAQVSPEQVAGATLAGGGTQIKLSVTGDAIKAELIKPPVKLEIEGKDIQVTVNGAVGGTAAGGKGRNEKGQFTKDAGGGDGDESGDGKRKRRKKVGDTSAAPVPQEDNEIERVITQTQNDTFVKTKQALTPFRTVTTTRDSANETTREEERINRAGELRQKINDTLRDELAAHKGEVSRLQAQGKTADSLKGQAQALRKTASTLETLRTDNAGGLRDLGLVSIDRSLARRAGALKAEADVLELKAAELAKADAQRQLDELNKLRESRAKTGERNRKADEAAAKREADRREKVRVSQDKLLQRLQTENEIQLKAAEVESIADLSRAAGFREFKSTGSRVSRSGKLIDVQQSRFIKEADGQKTERTVITERDRSTGNIIKATAKENVRAIEEVRNTVKGLDGDLLRNTAKVATWAASVGVLYGSLNLARQAIQSMIDTSLQVARLDQVFRGVGGSSRQLADDVLSLAANEGRSKKEALDAAIAWSRLGLTRLQVNEAVRVSLRAANVAEIEAGEATEQLAAIYSAYRLQVGQLAGVLGQLNQVSNTFRVTNKDLLEGISRTASVAQQAGLPLSQLIGIIGAVVGTTSQTGANIGNAVKSLAVSLANPEIQKFLRQQFSIEVTTRGGQDVQNLSDTLADVYVSYQKLTKAEQEHFLVQVAGKTQASRVAAILDQYIRAQTLAINAQLNLNSAEEENARIRDSLKNQLAGIVTEWERLIAIQANRGPAQALGRIAESFRNVLGLMNTPLGSGVFTGMIALFTALAARVGLTVLQMRMASGSTGMLANSMRSMGAAVTQMNAAITAGNARIVTWTRWLSTMHSMFGVGAAASFVWSSALGKASAAASMAFRTLATVAVTSFRMIGASIVSFLSFLPQMALISGGIWLFNRGMEALGSSSEAAERDMAGFNEEAERAAGAMNAASDAAKLFQTIARALPNAKTVELRTQLVEQAASVAFPEESGAKVQPKTQALEKELRTLVQQNRLSEVGLRLEQLRAEAISRSRVERQRQFEASLRELQATRAEIDRLKNIRSTGGLNALFVNTDKIGELERKLADQQGKYVQMRIEDSSSDSENLTSFLEQNAQYQAYLARQKATLESIEAIYTDIGGNDPFQQRSARVAGLEAQLGLLRRQKEELAGMKGAQEEGDRDRAARIEKLNLQITLQREKLALLNEEAVQELKNPAVQSGARLPNVTPEWTQQRDRAAKEIEELELQRDYIQKNAGAVKNLTDAERSLKGAKKETEEQIRKNEAALSGERAALELDRLRARNRANAEIARSEVNQFDAGDTDLDRLLNRERGLRRMIEAREQMLAKGGLTEAQQQNTLVALTVQRAQLIDLMVDKEKERFAILKSEQELQRKMLTEGAADQLRRVVADRYVRRGVTPAQFFSFDEKFRESILEAADRRRALQFRQQGEDLRDAPLSPSAQARQRTNPIPAVSAAWQDPQVLALQASNRNLMAQIRLLQNQTQSEAPEREAVRQTPTPDLVEQRRRLYDAGPPTPATARQLQGIEAELRIREMWKTFEDNAQRITEIFRMSPRERVQSEMERQNDLRSGNLQKLGDLQTRQVPVPFRENQPRTSNEMSTAALEAGKLATELANLNAGIGATRQEFALTGQALTSFREDMAAVIDKAMSRLQGGVTAGTSGAPFNPQAHG